MQITICERGCGKTSLDKDNPDIQKLSIRVLSNSDEPFDRSIEVCKWCREAIVRQTKELFALPQLKVRVNDAVNVKERV